MKGFFIPGSQWKLYAPVLVEQTNPTGFKNLWGFARQRIQDKDLPFRPYQLALIKPPFLKKREGAIRRIPVFKK
jgi:hypothetical protein